MSRPLNSTVKSVQEVSTRRIRHHGELTFTIDDVAARIAEAEEDGIFASIYSPIFEVNNVEEEEASPWKFRLEVILNSDEESADKHDRCNEDGQKSQASALSAAGAAVKKKVSKDLEVALHSEDQQRPRASVKFSIIRPETREVVLWEEIVSCIFNSGRGFADFIRKDRLIYSPSEQFIFSGNLTLLVEVTVITEAVVTDGVPCKKRNVEAIVTTTSISRRGREPSWKTSRLSAGAKPGPT